MESTSNQGEIPADMQPDIHELPGDLSQVAEVIEKLAPGRGVAITLALVDRFRGTYCYFHNVDALKRAARDRLIRHLRDEGVTVPEIARRVGLGERRVWDICNDTGMNDHGQLRLF